jgi:hypothetical protein
MIPTDRRNREDLPPSEGAALLADLVDVLIPGGGGWPSAASIGVQGLVAMRLTEQSGELELGQIAAAIIDAGGPFDGRTPEERIQIVARFEAAQPDLFERLRAATILAYYESPFVAEAIRRLGRPYQLKPHVTGYPMTPFDFAKDTPRHGRGSYLKTADVQRVDTSGLHLDEIRTERWGLER